MTVHTVPRATKNLIRAARDQAVRAKRDELINMGDLKVCNACGSELDTYTHGCKTCWDRKRRATRRQNPVLHQQELERERERQQASRARRRASA